MNKTQNDIITILNSYLKKDYSFSIDSDIEDIYKLSNRFCLSPIVGYTLNKTEKYRNNVFNNLIYLSNINYEKQQYVRKKLGELLTNENIGYIFLKGSTLAKYYEEPYLRFSSDIDVIVEKNNYQTVKKLLLKREYKLYQEDTNEMCLIGKNGVTIDVHCQFMNENDKIERIFNDVDFSDANHEMDNNLKYLHIITHAYKHLTLTYINLQFLVDIYYVRNLDLDWDFINGKLNQIDLKRFNDEVLKVIDVLFNNKRSNALTNQFIDFLLNASNHMGIENQILSQRTKSDTYIIDRAFPSYKEMCRMYPILENKKYLLPVCYIRRLVDRIKKGKLSKAISEINVNMNIDKDKIEETKELFNKLGI